MRFGLVYQFYTFQLARQGITAKTVPLFVLKIVKRVGTRTECVLVKQGGWVTHVMQVGKLKKYVFVFEMDMNQLLTIECNRYNQNYLLLHYVTITVLF